MTQTRQDASQEQRRLLLKGALGASTVMTLGYGGAVAAGSLGCIGTVSGYPTGTAQFTQTKPTHTSGTNWAWIPVAINTYKRTHQNGNQNGSGKFEGFTINGKIYATSAPSTEVIGATLQTPLLNKVGWLLGYFNSDGTLIGTYPSYQPSVLGPVPATESCLCSVNPNNIGFPAGITYGG